MVFELLAIILVALILIYLAAFSPKFDRFVKRLFGNEPESADGIANKVQNIEQEKAAAKAAIASREQSLAQEKAKLDKINIK